MSIKKLVTKREKHISDLRDQIEEWQILQNCEPKPKPEILEGLSESGKKELQERTVEQWTKLMDDAGRHHGAVDLFDDGPDDGKSENEESDFTGKIDLFKD